VYWYAHIGNFRTFIFYDVLRRALEFFGYRVRHVMNITDVGHLVADADTGEEKMAEAAKRERKTAWQVADFYAGTFMRDARLFNLKPPTKQPRATEHIKEQIAMIQLLEEQGHTYVTEDGVYFNTATFPAYGKLSGQSLDDKQGGKRVSVANKKHPADFALWKFSPASEKRDMEWQSPWGVGFPGWHIECSAMSRKYLGQPFDIHAGGIDHMPVHHENEIAQSEAAYGVPLANYWMHGEFMVLGKPEEERRMGKSEGNIKTVSEIVTELGVEPLAFRYLCLTTHYRSKLYFSEEALKGADQALKRLRAHAQEFGKAGRVGVVAYEERFRDALANDLDTPTALATVWEMVRNPDKDIEAVKRSLLTFDSILGLDLDRLPKKISVPRKVRNLVADRETARQEKDWQKADALRSAVQSAGYDVEDTADGPRVHLLS
jgi:cysteinyl-tRNA synthetase